MCTHLLCGVMESECLFGSIGRTEGSPMGRQPPTDPPSDRIDKVEALLAKMDQEALRAEARRIRLLAEVNELRAIIKLERDAVYGSRSADDATKRRALIDKIAAWDDDVKASK